MDFLQARMVRGSTLRGIVSDAVNRPPVVDRSCSQYCHTSGPRPPHPSSTLTPPRCPHWRPERALLGESRGADRRAEDELNRSGRLLRCGEYVADVGVGAVRGIQQVAAFEERFELCLQGGEVSDQFPDVG